MLLVGSSVDRQDHTALARTSALVPKRQTRARRRVDVKIYVGNLPYSMDDAALQQLFESHGQVESAKVVTDRDTGRSRGFGFVEMPNDEQARKAIDAVNGSEVGGRTLTVNEARPRENKGGGRGGRGPRGNR